MADREQESTVKVVDRRWWAKSEPDSGERTGGNGSLKPTYVEELERQVAEKDLLVQETVAKYRQASTEFEEARLRLRREISKDVERARRDVIADLLEIVDNLERAIEAARKSPGDAAPLLQGVEMVHRQFLGKLDALGVKPIVSTGAPFDPVLHEAITTVPVPAAQDGIVIGVVRQGYRIGDDMLRPAAVAVGKSD